MNYPRYYVPVDKGRFNSSFLYYKISNRVITAHYNNENVSYPTISEKHLAEWADVREVEAAELVLMI